MSDIVERLLTARSDTDAQTMAIARDEIISLRAKVAALKDWVSDLQSGMYINCVYCGHRYGPDPGTPVAMADVLKKHIEQCPKHPLSEALRQRDEARQALEKIAGGFISTDFVMKDPPDWHSAFNQLQDIAHAALTPEQP